jgi:LmbE family N-acetylglucosaminyl deacetylase
MITLTDSESEALRPLAPAVRAAEARRVRALTGVEEAKGLDDAARDKARAELEDADRNLNEANAAREACEKALAANRKAAK